MLERRMQHSNTTTYYLELMRLMKALDSIDNFKPNLTMNKAVLRAVRNNILNDIEHIEKELNRYAQPYI